MKDDKKDEKKKLDAMMKDEFEPPRSFAGLTPLPPPSEYSDRPNADLSTRWKMFLTTYGSIPYADPLDEYCRNLYPISKRTLLHRWQGIDGAEKSIHQFYDQPATTALRIRAQETRAQESGIPNYNDPRQMQMEKNRQVHFLREELRRIEEILDNGVEVITESDFRLAAGGNERNENLRTLSVVRRATLDKEYARLSMLYRELTDENKKVVEHDISDNYAEILARSMKERGHVTREGISLDEIENAMRPQLPEGAITRVDSIVEGEIVEPEISYVTITKKDRHQ